LNLISLIKETRSTSGKGSTEGRRKMTSSKYKSHSQPSKSKVKVYSSITDALKKGYIGQIFSTKNSDRLYVITKRRWGKDDEQMVSGRVAKGFSPGSIPSSFSDVKKYSINTMKKYNVRN